MTLAESMARLDEIAALEPGWGGTGDETPVSPALIDIARRFMRKLSEGRRVIPTPSPTLDGELHLLCEGHYGYSNYIFSPGEETVVIIRGGKDKAPVREEKPISYLFAVCKPDCACGCDDPGCVCQDEKAIVVEENGMTYRVSEGGFAAVIPDAGEGGRTGGG